MDAFQREDGPQLIVCSMRAASQGITLTRASNVAFLELDWTPARHDQAEDRLHRIGQDSAVTAWYLLAPDTIDETMAELLQRKRSLINAVTDGQVRDEEPLVQAVVRDLRERPLGRTADGGFRAQREASAAARRPRLSAWLPDSAAAARLSSAGHAQRPADCGDGAGGI